MIPKTRSDGRRSAFTSVGAVGVAGLAVLAIVAAGLLAGFAVAPAVAGDNVALVIPEPETVDGEPGEEFEVTVTLRSHGGYDDVGVEWLTFRALYHPEYLSVDVEPGAWLEQGPDTDIETTTTTADDRGVAQIHQRRDPPNGGATGHDVVATLTVRIDDDAPPANATIAFHETEIMQTDDYRQPVHERNVTVAIDGGGDPVESFDHGDLEEFAPENRTDESRATDDGTGAASDPSDDGNSTANDTSSGEEVAPDDPESLPGFTLVAGAAALLAVALAAKRRSCQ